MRRIVLALVLLAAACGPDLKNCPGCVDRVETPPEPTPRVPPNYRPDPPKDMAAPPKPCPDLAEPPDLAVCPDLSPRPDLAEPPCDRPTCDQSHCGHSGHHCNHGSSCPFHKD